MEGSCPTQVAVLRELEKIAPGAPFLALGQTVFWDEPMKAGVALASKRLGSGRRFIAGVHDTDYFAKFAQKGSSGGFEALPHNDTTTKGIWSAAAEFSSLFGSETVVTRETLAHYGAKLGRIQAERPGYLDAATEAFGWRGVVALNAEQHRVTAEKQVGPLFGTLFATLQQTVRDSLACIAGPNRDPAGEAAERLLSLACEDADAPGLSLAHYYRRLLRPMYEFAANEAVDLETTTTTELLQFNSATAGLPRFEILSLFLAPESREAACRAYDEAVAVSETYSLERFGAGAIPFDLVIPGAGRGTLLIGTRGAVVLTPTPVAFSYKKRPGNAQELAALVEAKFGPDCTLVGKAVTLIGMLAQEFVFVFHEGASGYVQQSRHMHELLAASGYPLRLNPILRVGYEPWDALYDCCSWFRLPEPLRGPFGTVDLSANSFAARWREVGEKQRSLLFGLGQLRRPLELIRFLSTELRGSWSCLARQYESVNDEMGSVRASVAEIKAKRQAVVQGLKAATRRREEAERAKGRHWRDRIFEKDPTEADWEERERLTHGVADAMAEIARLRSEWRELVAAQEALVQSPQMADARRRRRDIALEAELARVKIVREAVVSTEGLEHAGKRPAAWWFPLVCPEGEWFRRTTSSAHYRLESLI
ncbi:MAG: hypothetical protein KF733_03450 [Fimbriimonadaceae bacterium]|nr:MAG: hypothetical protein KF733_03450 [Fimbriimonadaceae bacterium]